MKWVGDVVITHKPVGNQIGMVCSDSEFVRVLKSKVFKLFVSLSY